MYSFSCPCITRTNLISTLSHSCCFKCSPIPLSVWYRLYLNVWYISNDCTNFSTISVINSSYRSLLVRSWSELDFASINSILFSSLHITNSTVLICSPYLVKCFFLINQGFFIAYSQMNKPRKWIFFSIWYKNSGIRVYEVKRLCFSFYMALCMPFPLRRRTSRVYQDHLTFPEGPNFLRSAYP